MLIQLIVFLNINIKLEANFFEIFKSSIFLHSINTMSTKKKSKRLEGEEDEPSDS